MRRRSNKVTSLSEALGGLLHDGDTIAFSGMGGQQCVAAAHEVVRQGKKDLTLVGDSPCDAADIIIGAGLVRKVEVAWISYAIAGIAPNYRRAVEKGIPHKIEVQEFTNYTAGLRYLAGAMNLPFLPTRSLLGSDIPKYNSAVKTMTDPYSGQPLALVPAVHPDLALIHAHAADVLGNTQFLGWSSNAENLARAAKHTIVTCERIASTDEIRDLSNNTIVPQFCVDAVVECRYGAHPWNMPYSYAYDLPFHTEMMEAFETREGFEKWLQEWVFGCRDRNEYCNKVGQERLTRLVTVERKFCDV